MKRFIYLILLSVLCCTSILTVQAQLKPSSIQNNIRPLQSSLFRASSSDASSSDASPDEEPEPRPPLTITKKKEIATIFNLALATKPKLIPMHNWDMWEHYLSTFQQETFILAYGITEDKQKVLLKIEEFQTEDVNIDVSDTYYATLRFGVHELFADEYYLPDSMTEYTIPIYVTDPEAFRLYYIDETNTNISLTWQYMLPDSTAELWYIESKAPLTEEELSKGNWTLYKENCSVLVKIDRDFLKTDYHYYFQARHSKKNSDILHLIYQENSIFSENISGVRDEGGREEIPQPPVTLPPLPEDPTEDSTPDAPSEDTSPEKPSDDTSQGNPSGGSSPNNPSGGNSSGSPSGSPSLGGSSGSPSYGNSSEGSSLDNLTENTLLETLSPDIADAESTEVVNHPPLRF